MIVPTWNVLLTGPARVDFINIVEFSRTHFGAIQAALYRDLVSMAVEELRAGPDLPRSHARDDLFPGYRTLHISRRGRRGRHFLVYRASAPMQIEILRVLHDAMDMSRHLGPAGF